LPAGLFSSIHPLQDARTIQGRLAELGLFSVAAGGIWAKDPRAALSGFKKKSILKPGKCDKGTQVHLFKGTGK
jgi:hypothetical protein